MDDLDEASVCSEASFSSALDLTGEACGFSPVPRRAASPGERFSSGSGSGSEGSVVDLTAHGELGAASRRRGRGDVETPRRASRRKRPAPLELFFDFESARGERLFRARCRGDHRSP